MSGLFVAVAILGSLALFGLIFGDGIDRCAIGLAVIFTLVMTGGTSSSDQVQ